MELDYAGDLTPKQAWTLLKEDKNCQLIDCRSAAEWSLVGVPELDSLKKSPIFVEWQIFPMMEKKTQSFSKKYLKILTISLQKSYYYVDLVHDLDQLQNF